jgi:DNA-binding NarL/FixJ family response regulator
MSIRPAGSSSIRVLVADMSSSASAVVETLLGDVRFHFMGTVSVARELTDSITQTSPDVVVITTGPQGLARKSVELIRQAHGQRPQLRSVMLLDSWRDDLIVESFRAGATGVLCAADSQATVGKCIHSVHLGQIWANSSQLKMVLHVLGQQSVPRDPVNNGGREVLTRRELEVIRAVAEGMTNRNIASHLKLSEHTVKNYLFRVFDKLGVSNRAELLMLSLTLNRYKESTQR